jgi:hypothetical protein
LVQAVFEHELGRDGTHFAEWWWSIMKNCFLHAWSFLGGPNFVVASSSVERVTKSAIFAKIGFLISMFCLVVFSTNAANWYVDNSLIGNSSNKGTNWTTAWTNIYTADYTNTQIQAGDTVYISGGTSNSSQTYLLTLDGNLCGFEPLGFGGSNNSCTYQIGQDALHNGVANFDITNNNGSAHVFSLGLNDDFWTWTGHCTNDNKQHFVIWNEYDSNALLPLNVGANTHIAYINFTNNGGVISPQNATNIEVDHCFLYKISTNSEDGSCEFFIQNTSIGTMPPDSIFIHDNMCHVPENYTIEQNGNYTFGDDFMNGEGNGLTISNNTVYSYFSSTYDTFGNHQDFCQVLCAYNCKICYNYVQDFLNYPIYVDCLSGFTFSGANHVYIYNNIISWMLPSAQNNGASKAIQVGSEESGAPFNDIVVANNLVANSGTEQPTIDIGNSGSGNIDYGTNIILANNVTLNPGATPSIAGDTGVGIITNGNVTLNIANGTGYYVSYTQNEASNANFNLTSPDTTLIKAGTNLTALAPYVTTDGNGVTRPTSAPWDIGPYEYVSGGTNPAISVSPSSLNFGVVPLGATSNLNLTVQNTGSGTLAGTASVGSPFSILSGGSYSLGANQSQTVTVRFGPTVASNFTQIVSTQTVNFSGGSGTNATVSAAAVVLLAPTNITVIGSP